MEKLEAFIMSLSIVVIISIFVLTVVVSSLEDRVKKLESILKEKD